MTRDDLLAAFGDEHHRLLYALDGLDYNQITRVTLPDSDFTVQDILGDIVAWEEHVAGVICHLLSNPQEPSPLLDHKAWRAEQVALCRRRPLAEVMSQMYRVRQETCALVAELTDEQMYTPRQMWISDRVKSACGGKPITIAEILEMMLRDCQTHRQTIEKWQAERHA
ncbi:MAG: DinB family protein [Anaerolineae bacterium]|nr:DinB family protein [Anaerolineae bacterium]